MAHESKPRLQRVPSKLPTAPRPEIPPEIRPARDPEGQASYNPPLGPVDQVKPPPAPKDGE